MVTLTQYEVERQRRISENKQRMAQLGLSQTITDIKTSIHTEKVQHRREKAARQAARQATAVKVPRHPNRRSERVQGQPAPVYDERILAKADLDSRPREGRDRRLVTENQTQEVYNLQHLEALGDHNAEWELFVNGYDADGNRIYDKVSGQTCHQCRQKTLGKRTSCSECHSLQGVLCGDCLFMRYGENVEEVNANPDWVCPNCRDLCNCSFHRNRRGWAPTGTLYRRAIAEGFKSVAHYLVLNNLEDSVLETALPLMPAELAADTRKYLRELKEKPAAAATPSASDAAALQTASNQGCGSAPAAEAEVQGARRSPRSATVGTGPGEAKDQAVQITKKGGKKTAAEPVAATTTPAATKKQSVLAAAAAKRKAVVVIDTKATKAAKTNKKTTTAAAPAPPRRGIRRGIVASA